MRTLHSFIYIMVCLGLSAALFSCSATSHLPEGELLYEGIGAVTYEDAPVKQKVKKKKHAAAESDTTGVIIAVAEAAETIENIFSGKTRTDATAEEARRADSLLSASLLTPTEFAVAQEEVEAVLAYEPNNSIFGSSYHHWPWRFGIWTYNAQVGKSGKFHKWLLKTFGTQPVLVSSVAPETRAKVATNTLRNYGFFSARVASEVYTLKNPRKARISYNVRAGARHHLDSIAYLGFPLAIDTLLRQSMRHTALHKGDGFSALALTSEQSRIEELLRERGFYYFTADDVSFRADTLQRAGFVQLQVRPAATMSEQAARPWYIGKTHVVCRRSQTEAIDQQRGGRNFSYAYSGEKPPLRAMLFRRASAHRRGTPFSLADRQTTLSRLSNLGVFASTDVSYAPRDTSATCDTLDVYITTVLDKLYDSTFEVNATFKSNQQVGPGVSYELAKRNAFRGAETVAWKIFGSYEWQTGRQAGSGSLLNSYEIGTSLSLTFPRLLGVRTRSALSRMRKKGDGKLDASDLKKLRRRFGIVGNTSITIDADWRNRSRFFQMFSGGLSLNYSWQRRSNVTHQLTPLALDIDHVISTTAPFDSILNANPTLAVSMRDYFIPSLSYTYTYQSSASQHRNPVWLQISVKEAGAVTSAIFAATGKGFDVQGKRVLGNPFAQYIRLTAEAHQTFKITKDYYVAARLFAGVLRAYGNSRVAPYYDQFYVGGANSIRAFTVRSVGPGAYRSQDKKYSYIDQTGDFKLEANVEFRMRLIGALHGAIFLDAGNVWLLRDDPARPDSRLKASTLRRIALGTGAGLRYDLDFFVLRVDCGIGLHAPYNTSRSGFYNIEKFKDGLGIHLAIGYPF